MPLSENTVETPRRTSPWIQSNVFLRAFQITGLIAATIVPFAAARSYAEDGKKPPEATQKIDTVKPEEKEKEEAQHLWERKEKIRRGTESWILIKEMKIEKGKIVITERKVTLCLTNDGKYLVINRKFRASCSCLGLPIEMDDQEVLTMQPKNLNEKPTLELHGKGKCLGYGAGTTILTPEMMEELVKKIEKGEEYKLGVQTIGDEFITEATFKPVKEEKQKE